MMTLIPKLLSKLTMYQAMLWFLRALLAASILLSFFGVLDYVWWHILGDLALFIAFCVGSNMLFARIFGVKPNYESQYITAEILTLIVGPLNPLGWWWAIFLISFMAMASKYLLAYKKRHIFNPAAFGVLASALITQIGASWWIGGRQMFILVLVGGLLILQKLRWFHLASAFFLAYATTLVLTLFAQGADNSMILASLKTTVLDSALVFFMTVMLIEPLTAPRGIKWRMAFGAGIGLLVVLHQSYWPAGWPTYGYSFEAGLLLGNFLAFLASNKNERQTLKFLERKAESPDTYSFWFEPFRKFDFIPGQFLEWTLAHKHDSRGVRRFFTISASPTEDRLRLITRLYPKPSSYKQALMSLKQGDEIVVSHLDGEFVLPKDPAKKLAFIAGGVGIAPFLSIGKYLVDKKESRDMIMLYANKTERDIAFREELSQFESAGLKTIHVLTEAPTGWAGRSGFITEDMVRQDIPDWKDRTFFVSGPEPMVLNYENMLKKMGLPGAQVRRDYFEGYDS
jgi:glycine betaine catabolism B